MQNILLFDMTPKMSGFSCVANVDVHQVSTYADSVAKDMVETSTL